MYPKGHFRLDEEYLEALKRLRDRILKLREEKANLLSTLDDLEADAEAEAGAIEEEIAVLQSKLGAKKKKAQKQEIVFSF
jgi:DNA repair exonuclease SbcCD ATPase subunit